MIRVELEVGDEVIWTFALMIYLERTVLACGAAYGILILQNPLFPFAYLYFFFQWSGLVSLPYLIRALVVLWEDITRTFVSSCSFETVGNMTYAPQQLFLDLAGLIYTR